MNPAVRKCTLREPQDGVADPQALKSDRSRAGFAIELIEIDTGKVERVFEYQSESSMLRAERGLLRQIDTDRYFTRFKLT